MLKELRHRKRVRKNLRGIKRYYGVTVSKQPKRLSENVTPRFRHPS